MNDKNGFIEILVIIIVVIVACVATLTFLIVCLMKYAPCCQNYLQRKNINIPFLRQTTHDACVKCQLIEMGEMVCYDGICPGCGRVPPSLRTRRHRSSSLHF